jgi:hypothetical protein
MRVGTVLVAAPLLFDAHTAASGRYAGRGLRPLGFGMLKHPAGRRAAGFSGGALILPVGRVLPLGCASRPQVAG